MKRIAALFLALLFSLSLFSCSSEKLGGLRTEKGEGYPTSFLSFDGKKVEFSEFRYYYLNYRDMYLAEDPEHFSKEGSETALKEEILQCLLDQYALAALIKEKDIRLDRDEKAALKTQIEEAKAPFESEEAFLESLHSSYMTEAHFKRMMEQTALSQKLFDVLFAEGGEEVFDDEEYYRFFREHYYAVQEIFIPYEKSESDLKYEKTMEKAEEIRQKALDGEDFWELVKTYGKDEKMPENPDGYYFTEGECEEALFEATKKLEIGGISECVVGTTGIYVLRRMELKESIMDERRQIALFGYTDALGNQHPGEYDNVLMELVRERSRSIQVEYGESWDAVSTKSVY